MAEVVVSAVVGVLVENLFSDALMKFARSQGIDAQLEEWKKTLGFFQAVLADAGQKEITMKAVKVWLNALQQLAYDIEDVLDDIATEVMKRKYNQESDDASANTRSSKLLKTVQTCFSHFAHNLSYGHTMSSKLEEITSRMKTLDGRQKFLGLENREVDRSHKTDVRYHQTSQLLDVSAILGREGDKEALLGKLLGDEEAKQNVSIVSIVGMGGIGKTTLARLLYNDEQVTGHFEVKAWVCVSDNFDVLEISKQIYQAVFRVGNTCTSLDLLHKALTEELSNKRFLLVLDDVWNEQPHMWEALKRPLVGAPGSKILVTTRSTKVSSVMNSVEPYNLGVLSDDLALSLFARFALDEENFDKHQPLKFIAQGIVNKCGGLPLALIALGRVLKTKGKEKDEWEELLSSDIWNLEDEGVLPALKLSYYHLPSHLKQLFAFCSLFPKDYVFKKRKLVLLWMALGFLSQPKVNNQTMESLGGKYFEALLSRSFFQHLWNDEYIMHDLMNDLATSVAGEFFFRLDENMDVNGSNEAYEKFRHFSFIGQRRIEEYEKFKELQRARCLRTFLSLLNWGDLGILDTVTAEILPHLNFLRVLSLTNDSITKVPQSIGNLKHLRYLNFSKTDIQQIPEEVSELYNLQSLLVCECRKLSSLPVSFAKLKNLRHLDMTKTRSLKKLPLGIGGLTSLQTLSKVFIQEDNGFKISELKALKDLQGELSIKGLEKVIDPTEAKDANLQQKKGLQDLAMVWGDTSTYDEFYTKQRVFHDSRDPAIEYDVLERLRAPHSNLKKLNIRGYGGMEFPSWLGDHSFDQLTVLKLRDCHHGTELATLGHLTSLRKLEIYNCPKVVNVGSSIMGSLRQVTLYGCCSLESYCCPNSVERLEIKNCPSMTSLSFSKLQEDRPSSSSSSSNLKNLKSMGEEKVVNVGTNIMGSLKQVTLHGCSLESYCCPNSVERLYIKNCSSMISLSFSELEEGGCPSSSTSSNLKFFRVKDCKNIKSISQEHLQSLTSLEEMGIYKCPSMEDSFPSCGLLWPPNLRKLKIGELKKPMLEWGLQNYPSSLVELKLYGENSGVASFGIIEEQDHNNMRSACFLLPRSLTKLQIKFFDEVESESESEVRQLLPHLKGWGVWKRTPWEKTQKKALGTEVLTHDGKGVLNC